MNLVNLSIYEIFSIQLWAVAIIPIQTVDWQC